VTGPNGLLEISRFLLPRSILVDTIQLLQEIGDLGLESFVLWGGVVEGEGDQLRFTSVHRPAQQPHRTPYGLAVSVPGDELARMNLWLYQHGEILAAQVHSHPTDAFHSDTDNEYPLVTLLGALSAVAPYFARGGLDELGEWAWFRLTGVGQWSPNAEQWVEVY